MQKEGSAAISSHFKQVMRQGVVEVCSLLRDFIFLQKKIPFREYVSKFWSISSGYLYSGNSWNLGVVAIKKFLVCTNVAEPNWGAFPQRSVNFKVPWGRMPQSRVSIMCCNDLCCNVCRFLFSFIFQFQYNRWYGISKFLVCGLASAI